MKKSILALTSLVILANASTITVEKTIKHQFDTQILPIIMKHIKNNENYTITLNFDYIKNNQIKIKVYTPTNIYSNLTKLHKKGNYSVGLKYYTKYIAKKSQIKVTDFVKIIGAKNTKDLDKLFANNAKLLMSKLEKEKQFYAIDGMIKIIKKYKLDDLKAFLKGVLAGKIPASCS